MKIIYWSQTGNTEKIAELIKKGIEIEGMNAELAQVTNVLVNDIENEKVIILGCPSCGEERMKSFGAKLISQGLRINETPEEDSKECLEFGKLIAKEAMGE